MHLSQNFCNETVMDSAISNLKCTQTVWWLGSAHTCWELTALSQTPILIGWGKNPRAGEAKTDIDKGRGRKTGRKKGKGRGVRCTVRGILGLEMPLNIGYHILPEKTSLQTQFYLQLKMFGALWLQLFMYNGLYLHSVVIQHVH